MGFQVEELLVAAGGDRREALRMLFALARLCAERPEAAKATGPELAEALGALLECSDGDAADAGWRRAHQLVTVQGGAPGGPATAAQVADAIEEVLTGKGLELAPADRRYDEEALLGMGGMGRVLRVHDHRLGRSVALKALRPGVGGLASARRFAEEAKLTAQLDHPNIVPLYDFEQGPDGGLFFTMKEVQGRSMAQAIDDARHEVRRGRAEAIPEILRLVRWFRQVCDGVAFAHQRQIAHRDLKPDNVMIGDFGEVQVMDWGLAASFGSSVSSVEGTPQYMAPEVASGRHEQAGPSEDIYALGATLYHLLCFELPYLGRPHEVLAQVQRGPPPPPSDRCAHTLPAELEAVVLRAMQRDPSHRYPTVGALADDVQAWLDGRPLASLSYGRAALLMKWMARNRRLVSAVGLTVGVALALGLMGSVRYVRDITEARDDARVAEQVARERMVAAQLAAARASTETARYGRADALYRAAAAAIEELGAPALGVQMGRLDNRSRAERPLLSLPGGQPGQRMDPTTGALYSLEPGKPVVLRRPPTFEAVWRSQVEVPMCLHQVARWEHDTLALYCATPQHVARIDLSTGASSVVTPLLGLPPLVLAPPHTDLLFVGHGDAADLHRDPDVRWWALSPAEEGWDKGEQLHLAEVTSASGPWFLGDRYGAEHGTVLYHQRDGPARTVGRPRARGVLSPDGQWAAVYDEGRHELVLEPLGGGAAAWSWRPDQPLVAHAFSSDRQTLLVGGSTGPTMQAVSVATGEVLHTFDGHDGPALQALLTDELVVSRGQDGRVLGHARTPPSDRVAGQVMGLLPPGDVLAVKQGSQLQFVDVATREVLRTVPLGLAPEVAWEAESVQSDGVLVGTDRRLLFVPLAPGAVEVVVQAEGGDLHSGDRLEDGHVAFCRGSEVVLMTPDGVEHALGTIEREVCRDLQITSPQAVFVSDFWGFAVHRFALGHAGPVWTARHDNVVYRLATAEGLVAVGDLTGRVSVYDAASGAMLSSVTVVEGPVLGTALSADGRFVAAAGWDRRVVVLDRLTGRAVAEDRRHDVPVEWVTWGKGGRRLVSADPSTAVVRDLELPRGLDAAHDVLSELAAAPERPRGGEEWADVARALAANGLWGDALEVAQRSEGVAPLELARWQWSAGRGDQAAATFRAAARSDPARRAYLLLCAQAAGSLPGSATTGR